MPDAAALSDLPEEKNAGSGKELPAAEDAVAQIVGTDQRWDSLQEAIDAAENGAVIQLLKDTQEDVTIPADKTLTLDLNGSALTNVTDHTIVNHGTLTVEGTGTVDNVTHGKSAVYNSIGATATLRGGRYTRSQENGVAFGSSSNSGYAVKNYGILTIQEGAEISLDGPYSSLVANGWQNYAMAVRGSEEPTPVSGIPAQLVITGGTLTGGVTSVRNDDNGEVQISGGTLQGASQYAVMNWNVTTITGGRFSIAGGEGCACVWNGAADPVIDQGKLTIADGYFSVPQGADCVVASNEGMAYTVAISGGYYTQPVDGCWMTEQKTCRLLDEKAEGLYAYQVTEKEADEAVTVTVTTAESSVDEDAVVKIFGGSTLTPETVTAAARQIRIADGSQTDVLIAAKKQAEWNGKPLDSAETLESALAMLKAANPNGDIQGDDVTILLQPKLYITPVAAAVEGQDRRMTFDIALVYDVKATTDPDNQQYEGQSVNTVFLKQEEALLDPPEIDLTLGDIAGLQIPAADAASVYVEHSHEGVTYYYQPDGTASTADGKYVQTVTFHNPNGFSPFTVRTSYDRAQIQVEGTQIFADLTLDCVNKALPSYTMPGYTYQGLQFKTVAGADGTYRVLTKELLKALSAAYGDGAAGPITAVAVFTKDGTESGPADDSNTHHTTAADTLQRNPATNTTTQSGPTIEYYTCPACGYHNWTATATGYKCDHCGYVESTKQLSSYGNVKGVYDPQSAAAQASATSVQGTIPQTSDDMPLVGLVVVAVAALLGLGVTVVMKKRNTH